MVSPTDGGSPTDPGAADGDRTSVEALERRVEALEEANREKTELIDTLLHRLGRLFDNGAVEFQQLRKN